MTIKGEKSFNSLEKRKDSNNEKRVYLQKDQSTIMTTKIILDS